MLDWDDDTPPAAGIVPVEGRGSLPFALLHGESLVAVATWALGEAGVVPVDFDRSWSQLRDGGADLVVHDPLCAGTPAEFLAAALAEARDRGEVVVGVRPVTDTVRPSEEAVDGTPGVLGATVDRTALVAVASPVVLPAAVLAGLDEAPDLTDLPALVQRLAAAGPVHLLEAPGAARRVADESDVRLLEALTDPVAG